MACRRLFTASVARGFSSSAAVAGSAPGGALKHRPIMPLAGVYAHVANDAFVAPSATVVRRSHTFTLVFCVIYIIEQEPITHIG